MPRLSQALFEAINTYLIPFMKTRNDREGLLIPILSQWTGYDAIEWEGHALVFTARLVEQLPDDLLKRVLLGVRSGYQDDELVEDLCVQIDAEMRPVSTHITGTETSATESRRAGEASVSAENLQVAFPHTVSCAISMREGKVHVGRIELKNTGKKAIPAGWRGKLGLLRPIDFRVTLIDTIVLPSIPATLVAPIGPLAVDVPLDIIKSGDGWHLEFSVINTQGDEKLLLRTSKIPFI